MIQVINGEIKKHGLPKYIITETGETILNYHLQDEEVLKQDGWLYVEENRPEYNSEIEYLHFDHYEILDDKVVKHYIAEPVPKSQLELLEEKLLTPTEIYSRLNISSIPLEELKQHKLNQLNELCNKAIVSGFTYEFNNITYLFSASLEAQSNFIATNSMFADGLIQDVEWTVVNTETNLAERIILTQEEFNTVKMIMFSHVNSQIAKFRNILQPQVLEATTNEQIDAITW